MNGSKCSQRKSQKKYFRQSIHPPFPSYDLGGFQIDKGQDHLAWPESLAHFSEVDFTYFFMLDDEKTNRYNID